MLEPIGNSVAVITGVIQLVDAIHRSIEAVKDAPQQLQHLKVFSRLVGSKLKKVDKALQQSSQEGLDDDHATYLASISGLISILHADLDHILTFTNSHNNDNTSKGWFGRWKKRYAPMKVAVDMKLNLNKNALQRIERCIQVLTYTTTDLFEMQLQQPEQSLVTARGLMKQLASKESEGTLPEKLVDANSSNDSQADSSNDSQADSQVQLQASILFGMAFNKAKKWTQRSLESSSHSSSVCGPPETPPLTPGPDAGLPIESRPMPTIENNVGRMEWEFRHAEAVRLTAHAVKQGFPDVAATFHHEVMVIQLYLDGDADFTKRSAMEVEHIRILLKCLEVSQQRDGLTRLAALTARIGELAAGSPPVRPEVLFQARVDVGQIYYDMQRYEDAIRHLRDALFEGEVISNHTQNRDAIRSLFKTICSAYKLAGDHVKFAGFRNTIIKRIGDPLIDSSGNETLFAFLNQFKWVTKPDMDVQSPNFGGMRDAENNSPLHLAVMSEGPRTNTDIVRRLSMDLNTLNSINNHGLTPLFLAVKAKDIGLVTILLDEGASLDIRMRSVDLSLTILHYCEDPAIMDLLLDHITPMRPRAMSEGVAALEPVSIDSKKSFTMETPLHVACGRNDLETARVLLKHRADIHSRNSDDQTALIIACYGVTGGVGTNRKARVEMEKLVKMLVDAGSDVDAVDLDNRTARKGLQRSGFSKEEIRALLSRGRRDSGIGPSPSSSLRDGGRSSGSTSGQP